MAKMIPLYSISSQTEIERRAGELFEQVGRPSGQDLDIWLRAEAEYRRGLPGDPGQSGRQPAPAVEN